MLQSIDINNFAIIDRLTVKFSEGLNIITGETGAGKSILMNALGLVLGDRADSSVLADKSKKCIVEACFSADGDERVAAFLVQHELDREDTLTLRREIAGAGKSRAFINDTPVSLAQVRELGKLLVDLHQQFDTMELASSSFQLEITDALAGNSAALKSYAELYRAFTEEEKKLQGLIEEKRINDQTADYHQFLLHELEDIALKQGELETLGEELKRLTHAGDVKRELGFAVQELSEGETPVNRRVRQILHRLQSVEKYLPELNDIVKRLNSVDIELNDIASEIERAGDALQSDQESLERMTARLDLGYKLLKKHQVNSTSELLALQVELTHKVDRKADIDVAIGKAEKHSEELRIKCMEAASRLSKKRTETIKPFSDQVNELLRRIGMPAARLNIDMSSTQLNASGTDALRFVFDANKSGRFETLEKVASGGELNRLMLCIKSLVAGKLNLPTLIFDEIDSGISGEAARQVGMIMKELSGKHQMIAITHQPQIAAKADAHHFVFKKEKEGSMQTSIRLLEKKERVDTLARMLSGETPTASAVRHAKELLEG